MKQLRIGSLPFCKCSLAEIILPPQPVPIVHMISQDINWVFPDFIFYACHEIVRRWTTGTSFRCKKLHHCKAFIISVRMVMSGILIKKDIPVTQGQCADKYEASANNKQEWKFHLCLR